MKFTDITNEIASVAGQYKYHDPPSVLVKLQELLTQVLRLVKDWLESLKVLVPGFSDTRMVGDAMQFVLYGVGVLCFVLLVWVVWSRLNRLHVQTQLARTGAIGSEALLDATGWFDNAETLASQKQWKQACRALYHALLRLMDEKDILTFTATRTNYEYWYALSQYQSIQRMFRQVYDRVEIIWFGNRNADRHDYDECLNIYRQAEKDILEAARLKQANGKSA